MKKDIFLTIAIPTYNREKEIRLLLNSIYSQYCDGVEVIVCDNNSSDNTVKMISEEYNWVKLYTNNKNMGPDYNFLRCFELAQGQFVLLMGSDDLLVDGAIEQIIKFINENTENDIPVIYLNHCLFKNKYEGVDKAIKLYLPISNNYIVCDKDDFISITKARVTFMSCLLMSNKFINSVKNPEIYIGTSFIHTCILFEMTNKDNLKYGVISYPCVAANATEGSEVLSEDMDKWFKVFSQNMHNVLCEIAIKNGYSKRNMNKVFINEVCRPITMKIVKAKINNISVKKQFKEYVFPIVKRYWKAWFCIVPSYVLPRFFLKFLYCDLRTMIIRLKERRY